VPPPMVDLPFDVQPTGEPADATTTTKTAAAAAVGGGLTILSEKEFTLPRPTDDTQQVVRRRSTLFALLAHKLSRTQQTVLTIRARRCSARGDETDELLMVTLLRDGTEQLRSFSEIVQSGITSSSLASASASSPACQLQVLVVDGAKDARRLKLAAQKLVPTLSGCHLALFCSTSSDDALLAYSPVVFRSETISDFSDRLKNIAMELSAPGATERSLDDFTTLGLLHTEMEFFRSNNRSSLQSFGPAQSIPECFLQQVCDSPLSIGLVYLNEEWTRLKLLLHALHLTEAVRGHCAKQGTPDILSRAKVTERAKLDGREVAVIAQCVDRSPLQTVGMLAIQLCGAAYLPLNTADPSDRLNFLLGDIGVPVLFTQTPVEERLRKETNVAEQVIIISHQAEHIQEAYRRADTMHAQMAKEVSENTNGVESVKVQIRHLYAKIYEQQMANAPLAPADVCFLLATSGSTGTPKILQLTHSGFYNSMRGYQYLGFLLTQGGLLGGHGDLVGVVGGPNSVPTRLLQTAACTFDLHSSEIYGCAMSGAVSVLLPHGGNLDMDQYSSTIHQHHVTAIQLVPSLLLVLLEFIDGFSCPERLESLRQIICAGERFPPNLVERVRRTLPNVTVVINKCGPAECCIDAVWHRIDLTFNGYDSAVPVGKPLPNYSAYVVDPRNPRILLPRGSIGELLIGGPGVMRAYANRDDLTKAALLRGFEEEIAFRKQAREEGRTHAKAAIQSDDAVLYRTGDLATFSLTGPSHAYTGSRYEIIHMVSKGMQQTRGASQLSCCQNSY
jgi:non-ribosomal peptide synthetase component F